MMPKIMEQDYINVDYNFNKLSFCVYYNMLTYKLTKHSITYYF